MYLMHHFPVSYNSIIFIGIIRRPYAHVPAHIANMTYNSYSAGITLATNNETCAIQGSGLYIQGFP